MVHGAQSGIKKVKSTKLDFIVHAGGADIRFLALQPGSAMGVPLHSAYRFKELSGISFAKSLLSDEKSLMRIYKANS